MEAFRPRQGEGTGTPGRYAVAPRCAAAQGEAFLAVERVAVEGPGCARRDPEPVRAGPGAAVSVAAVMAGSLATALVGHVATEMLGPGALAGPPGSTMHRHRSLPRLWFPSQGQCPPARCLPQRAGLSQGLCLRQEAGLLPARLPWPEPSLPPDRSRAQPPRRRPAATARAATARAATARAGTARAGTARAGTARAGTATVPTAHKELRTERGTEASMQAWATKWVGADADTAGRRRCAPRVGGRRCLFRWRRPRTASARGARARPRTHRPRGRRHWGAAGHSRLSPWRLSDAIR
jgi:hypothetical protein